MPFGVVSGIGLGMGVLDFGGDRQRERGSFEGKFVASRCNQWSLCDVLFSNYFEDLLIFEKERVFFLPSLSVRSSYWL